MNRALISLLSGFLALTIGIVSPLFAEQNRPNVVLIFTDDQGSIDAGCYGAEDLETPHLDALARRGVRFNQFYAAAPVCSPSRAGLMTGRYPLRAGMPGNASSRQGDPGMSPDEFTLGELFQSAGYATAHIGKWHLGYSPETMPNAQGFDHSFGHMGGCIDNYSHFYYWSGPNRHDLWRNGEEVQLSGRFFPDLMVEEAERFLRAQHDRPFFLYFATNTPHYPYQGDPEWLERYADVPYPRDLYNAFVSTQDERMGRLLAVLDDLELRDDTIIIFQSDHGHSTEERAHFGGGNSGPYRGAKFSLFEGGLRVPAVISWPGQIPEAEVRAQLAHGCDWFPTLAELCEIPLPDSLELDGKSLVSVLESADAPSPHEVVHWHVGRGPNAQWAVRQGAWKLIGNPRDTTETGSAPPLGERFLSNLDDDLSETKDHANEHPQIVQELEHLHEQWLRTIP